MGSSKPNIYSIFFFGSNIHTCNYFYNNKNNTDDISNCLKFERTNTPAYGYIDNSESYIEESRGCKKVKNDFLFNRFASLTLIYRH